MPKLIAGDVAPHDLREISSFLRNLNGAGIEVQDQVEVVTDLMGVAEIDFDPVKYQQAYQDRKLKEQQIVATSQNPLG